MANNWFPHDSAAGMDQHVLMLRSEWGNAGYGMFWLALEAMYETTDGRLDAAALPALSIRMAEKKETVLRFFDYCVEIGLFIKKDGKIFSERLLEEKQRMLAKSEAQRQRAENRWEKEKNKKASAAALPGQSAGNAPTIHTVPTQPTSIPAPSGAGARPTPVRQDAAYGNTHVNAIIALFQDHLGMQALDESVAKNRTSAWRLWQKAVKAAGGDEDQAMQNIRKAFDAAAADRFHAARLTKVRYLEENFLRFFNLSP